MSETIAFFQQLLLYLGSLFCVLSLVRRQGVGITLFMAVLALHAGLALYEDGLAEPWRRLSFSLAALYAPAVWMAVRERLTSWYWQPLTFLHGIWFGLAASVLYYRPQAFELLAYALCFLSGVYLWMSCRLLYASDRNRPQLQWLSFASAVHIYAVLVLMQIYRLLLSAWLTPALGQLLSLMFLASIALCFSTVIFFNLRRLPAVDNSAKPVPLVSLSCHERAQLLDWRNYMREYKPYLDQRLTVADLAARMGVGARQLSELINRGEGKSFSDWVNDFRVAEAVARMSRSNEKVLAIALDSGFHSKSNFNEVFKRVTGETPSSYRCRLHDSRSHSGYWVSQ